MAGRKRKSSQDVVDQSEESNRLESEGMHSQYKDTSKIARKSKPQETCQMIEDARPKCNHYQRKCSIISPCCGVAFGCRICHDEYSTLARAQTIEQNRSISLVQPIPSQHKINRFKIIEIICRNCYTLQPSKTNACIECGIEFGEYHCSVCNLWMTEKEKPFHCFECGFCLLGGRENYTHCAELGVCVHIKLANDQITMRKVINNMKNS